MPNQYYNYLNDLVPGTRARSLEIDDQFAAIEDGFDKLANPDTLNGGGGISGTDSGSANAYAVTTIVNNPVPFNLQLVSFVPLETNTGASTLAVDGGIQYSITRNNGLAVEGGDLIAGVPLMLIYDLANTRWVIVGATDQQTKQENRPGQRVETVTSYTLVPADEAAAIRFTDPGDITVTVPNDSAIPVGFLVHLYQDGAGQVTVANGGGVSLQGPLGLKTRVQYSSISLMKVATTEWRVVGDATV